MIRESLGFEVALQGCSFVTRGEALGSKYAGGARRCQRDFASDGDKVTENCFSLFQVFLRILGWVNDREGEQKW